MKQYALELFLIGMVAFSVAIMLVPFVTAFFQRRIAQFKNWWFFHQLRKEIKKPGEHHYRLEDLQAHLSRNKGGR